jgi:hypothetical protein
MPTATTFTSRVGISDIIAPAQSIGAHLAAKLDCFSTDERTLTDELCDMLCIWLSDTATVVSDGLSARYVFDLSLTKTTSAEEVKTGADLELIVSSPAGTKRCLIQAKVLDPVSLKLRCDSKAGWKKLRSQLIAARREAGELAFLLVYIPGRLLDQQWFGFSTYEQRFLSCIPNSRESYFGATIIPVCELINPTGRWKSKKHKVKHDGYGGFSGGLPFGVSYWS